MSNLLLNQNSNFLLLLAAFMQQQQQQQQQQQNQIQAQQRDHSIRLLESLFAINPEPGEEAIELIAQRVESSAHEVANWFHLRREQALTDRQAAAELERLNPNLLATLADHLANRLPTCSPGQQSSRLSNANGGPPRPEASRMAPATAAAAATARALAMAAHQHQQQSQFNHNSTNASFLSPNSNLSQTQQYEELLAINNNNTSGAMRNHRLDHTNYLLAQNNLRAHSPPSSATSPHLNLIGYNTTSPNEQNMSNGSLQNSSLNTNNISNNNNSFNVTNNNNTNACPSSTLLSKLNAVTSRQGAHLLTSELDPNMIDLLESLYAINDNPEPGAIEMISKRVNVTVDAISDWFDKKRLKLNPYAGPRSPPANKKREGGRVVTFSEYQRSLLEAIFNENNYLHPQEYEELSKLIQVPSRNIKIWFKNRRSKQRLSRPPGSGDVTGVGGAALSGADLAAATSVNDGEGLLGQCEADDDLGVVIDTNGT